MSILGKFLVAWFFATVSMFALDGLYQTNWDERIYNILMSAGIAMGVALIMIL